MFRHFTEFFPAGADCTDNGSGSWDFPVPAQIAPGFYPAGMSVYSDRCSERPSFQSPLRLSRIERCIFQILKNIAESSGTLKKSQCFSSRDASIPPLSFSFSTKRPVRILCPKTKRKRQSGREFSPKKSEFSGVVSFCMSEVKNQY